MKKYVFILMMFSIAACKVAKPTKTVEAAPSGTVFGKMANPTPAPNTNNLTAIQLKYKDANMEQLIHGYQLYTNGACVQCHASENIYKFSDNEWVKIIDKMAAKAMINDKEKDAVVKYVLSIKALDKK